MKTQNSKIHYSDLYGEREEKFAFLESHTVKNTKWEVLNIEKFEQEFRKTRWSKKYKNGFYFFTPKMAGNIVEYGNFFGMDEIFSFNNVGGKPGDDAVLVGNSKYDVKNKVNQFAQLLKLDKTKARTEADKNLLKILDKFELDEGKIIPYNYRPFDTGFTYYDKEIYTRAVFKIKEQFDKENICLLATKIVTSHPFQHAFISEIFPDVIFLSNKGSTNTYVFPLYLYSNKESKNQIFKGQKKLGLSGEQAKLDEIGKGNGKTSNIKPEILAMLKEKYDKKVSPEEVFNYIYAVLYSNKYREKYQEFLKIDFPRVPFGKDYEIFKKLSKIGENLIQLHLLKDKSLEKGKARFMGTGADNVVRKRAYDTKENKIWINNEKYFDAVETEVWNYYIGGYQVLDKWLKDRIGKILNSEDIEHYLKIIECLKQTIKIQKEIDRLYK